MCGQKEIKELLPGYAEEALEPAGKERVEAHLLSCVDCRAEVDLLRLLRAEAVPDPGDAFWQAMPSRVRQAAEKEASRPKHRLLRGFPAVGQFLPRWAWSFAALLLLAVAAWVLFRPAPAGKPPEVAAIWSEYEYEMPWLSEDEEFWDMDSAELKRFSELLKGADQEV